MSNPLSSLKKPHKTPLFATPGQRTVPFRTPPYSDDESKLLDEITGGMATHRIRNRDPFVGGLPRIPADPMRTSQGFGTPQRTGDDSDLSLEDNGIPSDHDLMSTMMTRITQLEAKVAYQAKEMAEKDKKITVLTDKVKLLQKSQVGDDFTARQDLENKCYLLQQQIYDMETFLADYGMVWIGEKINSDSDVYKDDSESDEDEMWRPGAGASSTSVGPSPGNWLAAHRADLTLGSSVSQSPKFKVDYNLLIENIKDLNTLAGEGVASIKHTKDGARLTMPDPVQLTLYANGILMFEGPFRPFTDPSTQTCIQDIMDGYFPGELQKRYPDGVPFIVTDKREVHFEDKRQNIFKGAGQTLGGETKPSRLVPTKLEDKTTGTVEPDWEPENLNIETTSQLPGHQLTMQQFLEKLPQSVVKGGKLIDIRSSVGDSLQGGRKSASGVTLVETDTVVDMKKRLDSAVRSRTRDITTLRVKSEAGDHTYILKMKFLETVGDLRKYIEMQRPPKAPPFDIVSAYPNKVHSEEGQTLESAGLTPNAVLHLKLRKT